MSQSLAQSHHRAIASFVLRQGRYTPAQRKAVTELWPYYGVDHALWPVNITTLFGRSAPTVLEIGSGSGEVIVACARAHPENNYLAVEVHLPGVGHLLRLIAQYKLSNVRIIRHDALDFLRHGLCPDSIDQLLIFFPDPWPKKRHHKRRLLQPDCLDVLCRVLKQHGRLHIATDWSDYAKQIQELLDMHAGLLNLAGQSRRSPRPCWRPVSRYEQRAQRLGHEIWEYTVARTQALYTSRATTEYGAS